MTLGELYTKYSVFISSVNGNRIKTHRRGVSEVKVILDEAWEYVFPMGTELVLVGSEYRLGDNTVTFNIRSAEFTTESFYQAEVSGGYIPVNVLKERKPT